MKPLEVIWFESISAFSEQVLGLGPLRVSMKQLLYTFLAIALAMSLLNFAKNLMLTVLVPAFLLTLAYARPYGMGMEELLIDMVSFFGKRKHIGAGGVEAERKEEGEEKKRAKDRKEKEEKRREKEEEEEGAIQIPASTAVTVAETGTYPTTYPVTAPTATPSVPATSPEGIDSSRNILHYIVPLSKDFNLEITEKEYVIATGESTIHISRDTADALIAIEIKDNAVVRITVNRQ